MIFLDLYPGLDSLNGTQDPTEVLLYAHQLTHGVLGPLILMAFFLIILLASFFTQIRFNGRGKLDASFAAAGFATFGLALIMSMKSGLLEPVYVIASLVVSVIGVIWILWPTEPQY